MITRAPCVQAGSKRKAPPPGGAPEPRIRGEARASGDKRGAPKGLRARVAASWTSDIDEDGAVPRAPGQPTSGGPGAPAPQRPRRMQKPNEKTKGGAEAGLATGLHFPSQGPNMALGFSSLYHHHISMLAISVIWLGPSYQPRGGLDYDVEQKEHPRSGTGGGNRSQGGQVSQCPHHRAWGSQHCMFKVLKVCSRRLKIIYN